MVPNGYRKYDDDNDLRYTKEWLLNDERQNIKIMGEMGQRVMGDIMRKIPGGTAITNDRITKNVGTVYQQEKTINDNMKSTEQQQKEPTGGIVLPTQVRKATAVNPRTMTLYGLPKAGKTTAVSKLKNALILDVEDGSAFIDGMVMTPPAGAGPVSKYKWLKEVAAAIKAEGKPYDYVIIDTLSQLDIDSEWVGTFNYMNSAQGKAFNRDAQGNTMKPSDPNYESVLSLANGYGYRHTREAIIDIFDHLKDLGKVCTIFICHVADKMIAKKGTSDEVMVKDLALTGKVRDLIPRLTDAIGNVWNEDGELMVSFVGDSQKIGGIRATHLLGYSGKLDWNRVFIDVPETK